MGGGYEVDARRSSRKLTEEERKKLTILLHAGATGEWDYKELQGWDVGNLQDWGMNMDGVIAFSDDDEEGKERTQQLKPMSMVRVLISFPLDLSIKASKLIDEIQSIEGVEVDYGAN